MRYSIILIPIFLLLSACQPATTEAPKTEAKRYDFHGKVIAVDKAARKATIEHDEIPGYMDAMTMDFPIRENWVWENLLPGSVVNAELVVDNTADISFWLENIRIVAAANPNAPPPEIKIPAQIGKTVPPFSLTNQDGRQFTIANYRGMALAITFIYSECPLPEYCIKMSRNFSDLAIQLNANKDLRNKIRLLSISFDPGRDTPARLKQYGIGYLGGEENADFTVWQLAVGTDKEVRDIADFFGLLYDVDEKNKAQFNHSLVTAVISPDGIIQKIFSGNRWTPEDLLKELKAAAANRRNR